MDRHDEQPAPAGRTSLCLRRALAGDAEGLEELIRRVSPLLLAAANEDVARRAGLSGALDPRDLVSETWLRTLPRLEKLDPRGGRVTPVLVHFMTKTLHRLARDTAETQRRRRDAMAREAPPSLGPREAERDTVERIVTEELEGALHQALRALDPTDRTLVVRRSLQQIPTREVAEELGMSADAVKQRLRRALQRLRDAIPGSVIDELV